MNAVIYLDVPYWQIGQNVTVYFPDTMVKHCKCELSKEQEPMKPIYSEEKFGDFLPHCPVCKKVLPNISQREKVIKAYEDFVNGYECFCASDDYEYEMHKAVLALLKEQEAAYQGTVELLRQKTILFDDAIKRLKKQEPILLENQHKPYGISTNANSPWISRCPRCGKKVEGKQTRFCKYCGQAVKWT